MNRPIFASGTTESGVGCDCCHRVAPVALRTIPRGPDKGARVYLCGKCSKLATCDRCGRRDRHLTLEVGSTRALCPRCTERLDASFGL